ncbi:hypothetical protein BH11BAC7_BH11BAC7_21050 [soil metagenome]
MTLKVITDENTCFDEIRIRLFNILTIHPKMKTLLIKTGKNTSYTLICVIKKAASCVCYSYMYKN